MRAKNLVVFLAVAILLIGSVAARAQIPTGSITGTVLDPTGLAIPDAEVTVTNQDTGAVYVVTTSHAGAFTVASLPVGVYRVEMTASGFRTGVVTDIKLDAGTQYSVPPIRLEVGTVAETVTVEAGAELVHTTSAVITSTVENKQIQQLPLLDRSPLALLDLQAGVNANGSTPRVINGMRTSYSNVTVDGINVQDNFIRSNDLDFLPNLLLINQVNEFTILNQNAGPEYGFGSSQVTFSTPSGTNDWHGDIFWYHRNNKVAANDWFVNASPTGVKPKLIQNQGGFGVGGPLVKDKLFVYGYWELFRNREQDSELTTVLTPPARQGIFRYATQSDIDTSVTPLGPFSTCGSTAVIIPAGTICTLDVLGFFGLPVDPFVAGLLGDVPAINDPTTGDGLNTGGFRFNQRSNRTRDNYGLRVDWLPSAKHAVYGTWQWNRDIIDRDDIDATFNEVPVVTNDDTTKFFSGSYRWSPSGRFTNEFRGGFNLAPGIFATTEQFGAFVISNSFLFTNPIEDFRPQGRFTDTWNVQDNASYILGDHSMKFGAFFQRIRTRPFSSFDIPPTFDIGLSTFNPIFLFSSDFPGGARSSDRGIANDLLASLAGFVEEGESEFNVTSRTSGFVQGAPQRREFTLSNLSFYWGDSWRVRSNLTLNYGVRWEYPGRFDEKDALMLTPVLPQPTTDAAAAELLNTNAVLDFTGSAVDRPVYKKDLNNWAPQIGIAWDPWGNGKTAIRAGYSISYVNDEAIRSADNATGANDGLGASVTLGNLTNTISQIPSLTFPPPTFQVPRTLQDQFNEFGIFGPGSPATIFTVDPRLKTPYVQQWNLTIQQDVGWDTTVEVRYMGNRGVQLTRAFDFNQVIAFVGRQAYLTDFINARNNGFLNQVCNPPGGFNPAFDATCPGTQPLPFFNSNFFGGFLFLGFIRDLVQQGQAGELAAIYHFNGIGSAAIVPNPLSSVADLLTNISTSDYHAGVVEVRRRPLRGVYFQANYTFSKVLTDASGEGQTNFDPFLDILDMGLERHRAEFDLTHAFKANFVYDIPMGRGHSISSSSSALNKLIGGWSIASIFTWQTGAPFSILSNRGTLNRGGRSNTRNTAVSTLSVGQIDDHVGVFVTPDGVFVIDPQFIGTDGRGVGPDTQTCSPTLAGGGTALFCNPAAGTVGNLPRRAFDGPTFFNWDFSIIKHTEVTERVGIEFRAEFFNLPNHPTFFSGQISGDAQENINSTSFGQMTSTLSDRRIIQFGLRITF